MRTHHHHTPAQRHTQDAPLGAPAGRRGGTRARTGWCRRTPPMQTAPRGRGAKPAQVASLSWPWKVASTRIMRTSNTCGPTHPAQPRLALCQVCQHTRCACVNHPGATHRAQPRLVLCHDSSAPETPGCSECEGGTALQSLREWVCGRRGPRTLQSWSRDADSSQLPLRFQCTCPAAACLSHELEQATAVPLAAHGLTGLSQVHIHAMVCGTVRVTCRLPMLASWLMTDGYGDTDERPCLRTQGYCNVQSRINPKPLTLNP